MSGSPMCLGALTLTAILALSLPTVAGVPVVDDKSGLPDPLSSLLDAVIPPSTKAQLGSIGGGPWDGAKLQISLSESGLIEAISGDDFALDPAGVGCGEGELTAKALCFTLKYANLLGFPTASSAPVPRLIETTARTTVVQLTQTFMDFPLFGTTVTLLFDDGVVRSVTSNAVPSPTFATLAGLAPAELSAAVSDDDIEAIAWWSVVDDDVAAEDTPARARTMDRVILARVEILHAGFSPEFHIDRR